MFVGISSNSMRHVFTEYFYQLMLVNNLAPKKNLRFARPSCNALSMFCYSIGVDRHPRSICVCVSIVEHYTANIRVVVQLLQKTAFPVSLEISTHYN